MHTQRSCRAKFTEGVWAGCAGALAVWIGVAVVWVCDRALSDLFGLTLSRTLRTVLYAAGMYVGGLRLGVPVVRWLFSLAWFRRPGRKLPLAVDMDLCLLQWREALKRADAEPDLSRKQELIRQLSVDMNKAYYRWRIRRRHFARDP